MLRLHNFSVFRRGMASAMPPSNIGVVIPSERDLNEAKGVRVEGPWVNVPAFEPQDPSTRRENAFAFSRLRSG
jgi:hypothetical protein